MSQNTWKPLDTSKMSDGDVARPGTFADLSRRMDRMETAHEALAKEVGGLTATIARVEINQNHTEELNKLRADSMSHAITQLESKVTVHMERIERIISGEQETPQARAGEALVADYQRWRESVESRLGESGVLSVQLKFLGRLVVVLTGGALMGTAIALYAVFFK